MKSFILILGLVSLVGCSDIGVIKIGSNNPRIPEPEINLVAQKIELIPYAASYGSGDENDNSQPMHDNFIEFLEIEGISLTNAEKDLIRTDSDQFKVFLQMQFDGVFNSASLNPINNLIISQFDYAIEVRIGSRIEILNGGIFRPDVMTTAFYRTFSPTPQTNRFIVEAIFHENSELAGRLVVSTDTVFNAISNEHEYHIVEILYLAPGVPTDSYILSTKNRKSVSICDYYTGDLIDQYCPFNF